MKKKSIVLLSGGLDSTVNLAIANKKTKIILALTFDYSQKSAKKEISQSKKICKHYDIRHKVVNVPIINEYSDAALLKNKKLKTFKLNESDLLDKVKMNETAKMVWVPNRNGLFVNLAAVIGESLNADIIVMGLNKEEGESFPDNSIDFVKAINRSLNYSTLNKIKLVSYTLNKYKKDIVRIAIDYKVPLNLIWSCYFGEKKPCLKCISCLRFIRAQKK